MQTDSSNKSVTRITRKSLYLIRVEGSNARLILILADGFFFGEQGIMIEWKIIIAALYCLSQLIFQQVEKE